MPYITRKEVRIRCWIEVGGRKFFGPGPAELMEGIHESGSIAQAAKKMGLSYKKAWTMVNALNQRSRVPYIELQKGGKEGGGASLTTAGKKALLAYRNLGKKIHRLIETEKTKVLRHI